MGAGRQAILGVGLVIVAGVAGFLLVAPKTAKEPAEEPAGAGTTESLATVPGVKWETLARDLGSGDGAVKKAALTSVVQAPYQKREQLERVLLEVKDPAGREAIQKKLDDIYEMLATNPPPISLHVEHASLRGVAEALNEEMGTRMQTNVGAEAGDFTLDVDDRPFWEVIAELNKQGKAWGLRPGEELSVDYHASGGTGMAYHAISGPFLMFVTANDLRTTAPSFMLSYTILVDPRLTVSNFGMSKFEIGTDAAGIEFKPYSSNGGSPKVSRRGCTGNVQIPYPVQPGTTISSVKVRMGAMTYVPAHRVTIEAIEEKAPWEGTVGGVKVRVPAAQQDGANGVFRMALEAEPVDLTEKLLLEVFDKTGELRWSQRGMPGGAAEAAISLGQSKGSPYRLVARMDKRSDQVSAVLEVKDVPVARR